MSIPKLFISYSHDSIEHKKWVLELGIRLRQNGIDAILDQWELTPGDDLPHFMETHLATADYIVMICTSRYVDKANKGSGGVGYEKMIITSNLMSKIDENKIIPIIKQNGTYEVPTFLKTKLFIDFSKKDDYETSIDDLIRKIHNSPIFKKPDIGNNPFQNTQIVAVPQNDPMKTLMKILVNDFEMGFPHSKYFEVIDKMKISRIMFDLLVGQAKSEGYVYQYSDGDLRLENGGKFYAVQNGLVK